LISCHLVLQQVPEAQGLQIVRELLARLSPGGIAVFSLPYRSTAAPLVRASRWIRARVPFANRLVNVARRRPSHEPFIATHLYDLSNFVSVIQDQLVGTMNVLLEPHEGISNALFFVQRPMSVDQQRPGEVGRSSTSGSREGVVDVASLIAGTSIAELNRA